MRVQLLGTGAAAGWPNPWCGCASCDWARRTGSIRGQTSALVDGVLMLDCGPDAPRSAARLGIDLTAVRWVLLGHAHEDHAGAPAPLWRSWATTADVPLEVVGPPRALEAFMRTAPEGAPVRLVPLAAGDCRPVGPYVVRAHPAVHGGPSVGPAVLLDVTAPDGQRLLYATDTAPLPADSVPAGPYDVVLAEETDGDAARSGDHLGLDTFGDLVAALRTRGALRPGARVVAVHLGHGNPPSPELDRRLALLGTEVLPDGAVVGEAAPPPRRARRVLVTGGARSGKSAEAERRLRGEPAVVYVATAADLPGDAEWAARLDAHRTRRPPHWVTVETGRLVPLLDEEGPPLLVDGLGLWVARGEEPVDDLVAAWRNTRREVVLVTDEVGSGVVPATAAGRDFRDRLGALNARLAADADEVWQCVAGVACRLR